MTNPQKEIKLVRSRKKNACLEHRNLQKKNCYKTFSIQQTLKKDSLML